MDSTVISQIFSRFVRWFVTGYIIADVAPRFVKVPNSVVDMDSWTLPACYPRSSFCPMISRLPTKRHCKAVEIQNLKF